MNAPPAQPAPPGAPAQPNPPAAPNTPAAPSTPTPTLTQDYLQRLAERGATDTLVQLLANNGSCTPG